MKDKIVEWKEVVEEFECCDGHLSEIDRKNIILKMIPADTPSNVVTNLRRATDADDLQDKLEEEIDFLKDFGQLKGGAKPLHVVSAAPATSNDERASEETEQPEDIPGEAVVDCSGLDEATASAIMALSKVQGFRVKSLRFKPQPKAKVKPAPRPGRPATPPRTGTTRCGNCGEEGHRSQECKKPFVPADKRPCWNCKKVGHTAKDCTEKPVKMIDDAKVAFLG